MASRFSRAVDVLVVDDDETNRSVLREVLEDEGFKVIVAEDGAAGLAYLRLHRRPLVVILDWRMPSLDGMAVLRQIATETLCAGRVYLFLTAIPYVPSLVQRHLPANLDITAMSKPFDIDDLLQAVEAATQRLLLTMASHREPAPPPH